MCMRFNTSFCIRCPSKGRWGSNQTSAPTPYDYLEEKRDVSDIDADNFHVFFYVALFHRLQFRGMIRSGLNVSL
jgi:hypothetical protein